MSRLDTPSKKGGFAGFLFTTIVTQRIEHVSLFIRSIRILSCHGVDDPSKIPSLLILLSGIVADTRHTAYRLPGRPLEDDIPGPRCWSSPKENLADAGRSKHHCLKLAFEEVPDGGHTAAQ